MILRLSRHVVARALLLVARLAEVGVTPAEPLGYRTTEFAFVLDVVGAVLVALLHAAAN